MLARGEADLLQLSRVEDERTVHAHRYFPDDHDLLRARPRAQSPRKRGWISRTRSTLTMAERWTRKKWRGSSCFSISSMVWRSRWGGGAGVEGDVVVGGFYPVDLGGIDDDGFLARRDEEARSRDASLLQQLGDTVVDLSTILCTRTLLRARQRDREMA